MLRLLLHRVNDFPPEFKVLFIASNDGLDIDSVIRLDQFGIDKPQMGQLNVNDVGFLLLLVLSVAH
jgi:hypothetical protein